MSSAGSEEVNRVCVCRFSIGAEIAHVKYDFNLNGAIFLIAHSLYGAGC